jgi:hypothetical protein
MNNKIIDIDNDLYKIWVKYNDCPEIKHSQQLYAIGMHVCDINKTFEKNILLETLIKIINDRSVGISKEIKLIKKLKLIESFVYGFEYKINQEIKLNANLNSNVLKSRLFELKNIVHNMIKLFNY